MMESRHSCLRLLIEADKSVCSPFFYMEACTALLENFVLGDRQLDRWSPAPGFEDVEIEEQQEDLAGHVPARAQAVEQTALRFLEHVIEAVDDGLDLLEAGA